ncbi:hypothetical protein HJC23_004644 [Cyclotella cryptica]|uniref:Dienelactone hydrolase domain-containing protein n=1 Tax=Cyclotella cryptica TaxID=29204 RepID=A0ABD3QGE4_9STRA
MRSWGSPLDTPTTKSEINGYVTIGDQNDLELYVAKPKNVEPSVEKAILVFPDVCDDAVTKLLTGTLPSLALDRYGFSHRLFAICDKLAADLHCYVVVMDNFRGETMDDHQNDFFEWTGRHPYIPREGTVETKIHPVQKDVEACLDYLSTELGIVGPSNIASIGFCWGVWAMTKACATGVPFRCAVGFHPSLRFEEMFGGNILEMAKMAAKNVPLFYCVSGNDAEYLKPPNGDVSVALSSSEHGDSGDEKARPRCVEFPEMVHGWVSRGDTSVSNVKDYAEKALSLASDFLRHWM